MTPDALRQTVLVRCQAGARAGRVAKLRGYPRNLPGVLRAYHRARALAYAAERRMNVLVLLLPRTVMN